MFRLLLASAFLPFVALAATTLAMANAINTGEEDGVYHSILCPRLETELKRASFSHACKPSRGTLENLQRVLAHPSQIGYGQLDVLVEQGVSAGPSPAVTIMRRDDVRECAFAVTRVKQLSSYGELAAQAPKLRFILPPQYSGSAATFRYLSGLDPEGLGRATSITHAISTDQAIRHALSADDTVTLFVQLPDPESPRFKLVRDLGGHFVPVIDRAILRPNSNGDKIYFAQETLVANASWSAAGVSVVTACTPLVVFTGHPDRLSDEKARHDQNDLIATVRALPKDRLLPAESPVAQLLRRTKEVSAISTEQILKLSEEARERAGPLMERAKEAGEKALDAAKPALDRARQVTREIFERARQGTKDLMEKPASKPEPGK